MRLSDLITYFQQTMNKYGDHEVTSAVSGPSDQFKPMSISLELYNGKWVKKRTVTEDEEITIKRRETLYKAIIKEDTK